MATMSSPPPEEEEDPGPVTFWGRLAGDSVLMPGFCHNRLTDCACVLWLPPPAPINVSVPVSVPDSVSDSVSHSVSQLARGGNESGAWNYSAGDYGAGGYGAGGYGGGDWAGDWAAGFGPQEKTPAEIIYCYVFPVLLALGTLWNLLSLAILVRLSRHMLSTCVYLALLCVVDLIILYVRCGNDWLKNVSDLDLTNVLMVTSESLCQVYPFCFNFLFHLCKWLVVCMAVEGFIATRFPERMAVMCTLSRAKAVVLLLTVLLICINIHYFWSFKLRDFEGYERDNGLSCSFDKHSNQYNEGFQELVWPLLDLLVGEVLPYAVVICCGACMLAQVVSGRYRGHKAHQQWRERYQLNPAALDELKVTLLVTCICFLVFTLPKFAYLIFRYHFETTNYMPEQFDYFKWESLQILLHAVSCLLEYCFFACKFLIYFATSSVFRREFYKMFRKCCVCGKREYKDQDREAGREMLMA